MSAQAKSGIRLNQSDGDANDGTVASGNTGSGQSHSHNLSANYVGDANSVLQPYLVLIYIIKT